VSGACLAHANGIDTVAATCSVQTRWVTVVGLLARCDVHRRRAALPDEAEPRPWPPGWSPYLDVDQTPDDASASFDVAEFAICDDGTRVLLHEERGFTVGGGPSRDPWSGLSAEILESTVLTTVLPDDDDTDDEHPFEWLADLCRHHGLDVGADDLRRLPYFVELSDEVRRRLAHRSAESE
jgi:hypothetical protein